MGRISTEQSGGALDEDFGPLGDSIEDDEDLGEPTSWDQNTPDEHADAGLGDKAAGGSSTGEKDKASEGEPPAEEPPFDPDKEEWDKLSQEEAVPLIEKMTPEQLFPFLLRTSKFTEGMTANARGREENAGMREELERREASLLAREEALARRDQPGPAAPGAVAPGPTPQVLSPELMAQGRQVFEQLSQQLGRPPDQYELVLALSQGLIKQAVDPVYEYLGSQHQQSIAAEFTQQWDAVCEKYSLDADEALKAQVADRVVDLATQRPLESGDVEALYLSLGGEDSLQALVEKRAQELVAQRSKETPARAAASPPPGGTQSGSRPPTSDLDEIARRQMKRFG